MEDTTTYEGPARNQECFGDYDGLEDGCRDCVDNDDCETEAMREGGASSFTATNLQTGESATITHQAADNIARLTAETANGNGRPTQPTLDPDLFPATRAEKVKTIKVTISGTVEMPVKHFLAMLRNADDEPAGTIDAGDELHFAGTGFVAQPGAAWVKRAEGSGKDREEWWERQGRVKVKAEGLSVLQLTGEKWEA